MNKKTLGLVLKSERQLMNYSQEELSTKTGLSINSIRNYEQGLIAPNLKAISKIGDVLGFTLETLSIKIEETQVRLDNKEG